MGDMCRKNKAASISNSQNNLQWPEEGNGKGKGKGEPRRGQLKFVGAMLGGGCNCAVDEHVQDQGTDQMHPQLDPAATAAPPTTTTTTKRR